MTEIPPHQRPTLNPKPKTLNQNQVPQNATSEINPALRAENTLLHVQSSSYRNLHTVVRILEKLRDMGFLLGRLQALSIRRRCKRKKAEIRMKPQVHTHKQPTTNSPQRGETDPWQEFLEGKFHGTRCLLRP